jgi:DNA-binding NarL/FixJ family response regulator
VADICARLEGLPLAIELLAGHFKLLSPAALLARLSQPLHLLSGGVRDAPPRHRSLADTISWSYNLLDEQEQRLFRQMSVFSGGCDLDAAQAVCAYEPRQGWTFLGAVESLVDKNLLFVMQNAESGMRNISEESTPNSEFDIPHSDEPRLAMLQTIREYALEQLDEVPEGARTRRRHAEYYMALAEQAQPLLRGPERGAWLERLEIEQDNFRTALRWAREGGEGEIALRIAAALGDFWEIRAYNAEGETQLLTALAVPNGGRGLARARALTQAGKFRINSMAMDDVYAFYAEALAIFRELGDKAGVAGTLLNLGRAHLRENDQAGALPIYLECLATYRELGDKQGTATVLNHIGITHLMAKDYRGAAPYYEECLALRQEIGDDLGVSSTLFNLGNVNYYLGDYARSGAYYKESLAMSRKLGNLYTLGPCLLHLTDLCLVEGKLDEARRYCEEAVEFNREKGPRDAVAIASYYQAYIEARDGNFAHAAELLAGESVPILQTYGEVAYGYLAGCLVQLAAIVLDCAPEGDIAATRQAARTLGAAEALLEEGATELELIDSPDYVRVLAALRARLGEKALGALRAEGRATPPDQAAAQAARLVSGAEEGIVPEPHETLTRRERQVLHLIATGLTDAQIAAQLQLSPHTINAHCRNIYSKLGVDSRGKATHYAIEHHLA